MASTNPIVAIEGHDPAVDGPYAADEGWVISDDDLLVIAMLQDPIFGPEMCWREPANHDYGGCYRVYDYQYPLFRVEGNYAGFACARSVGKTESIKARAFSHVFKRVGENMLITAPELIHLLPLTEAIEDRLLDTRITRDFLDTRGGKTGLTHRPFGAEFFDGTRLVGRIPKVTGPQPLDAKILTKAGWTTMGEIEPGDEVVGPSGKPTAVLATTNTWEAEVYRIEFSDGSVTHADAKHRWRVKTESQKWSIQYTEDIRKALAGPPKHNGGKLNMYRVPQQAEIEFDDWAGDCPLDPYVVGALLGDGAVSGKHAQLICADEELVDFVRDRLPSGCSLTQTHPIKFLLVGRGRGYDNPVLSGLRELGLLGKTAHTKFIPDRLKQGSREERLEVLRGLLDTDGSVKDAGAAHLISASKRLIEDAGEIVRSLGGWASTGAEVIVDKGTYYRGTYRLPSDNLFRLKRKAKKVKLKKMRHRSIRMIEPVGVKEVRCIKVAADDEAYLTDDFIATLNTGVKGQHQPDMVIDEAQDYPEKGWTEIHETVIKDHTDKEGNPDFTYHFYGVHSGARDSGFFKSINDGGFSIISITAIQRPGWAKPEKDAAKARYGGTQNPDYRRNIYGEPGAAASAFFVTARLMACVDQGPKGKMPHDSKYNTEEYVHSDLRAEEVDELRLPMADILDFPEFHGKIYMGADLGLTNSPTVVSCFSLEKVKHNGETKDRLKLLRLYEMHRFRTRQIREVFTALAWHFGGSLQSFGLDITGLGFPIWQEMEDDETVPQRLRDVTRGYFFNAKVPVDVDSEFITKDDAGRMKDQYGSAVELLTDEWGQERLVTRMPMIEASTRYLREMVDSGFLMLPFDKAITTDMQGETQQRVRALGEKTRKPNAFHILDSFRAMAMGYKAGEVEEALEVSKPAPVLDMTF